jgi:hypothetical protein
MKGKMENQKRPDGTCHGRDLPDQGIKTGVSDTYGVSSKDLAQGYSGGQGIGKDTKSDG